MFQLEPEIVVLKTHSYRESTMDENDLSITSLENQIYEELCLGALSDYQPQNSILSAEIYPDVFPQYPKLLVRRLVKFTLPIQRNPMTKILNFQINFSLILCQISYKICKICSQFNQKPLKHSFQILSYYLKMHAIINIYKTIETVKILLKRIKLTQDYLPKNKKQLIRNILENSSINMKLNDGMYLLKQIDLFIFKLLETTSKMDCHIYLAMRNYNKQLFTQCKNQENKQSQKIQKISLINDIVEVMQKAEYKNLCFIQSKFGSAQIRNFFHSNTKIYINNCYKKVYQLYRKKPKSREITELFTFCIIVKINSQDLPFKINKFIQNEKTIILETSKILLYESFSDCIIRSNIYFRAQLPKIHLLMKNKGFMKLCSFFNEAEMKDIQKQISWCLKTNENLRNKL